MPNRHPPDNLLWLLFQAYRMARKQGLLPPAVREAPPDERTPGDSGLAPTTAPPAAGEAPERLALELDEPVESYADPTAEEAEAGQRLLRAVVKAADTRSRRPRQRLFIEKAADDEPADEKALPQLKTRIEELAEFFALRKEFKSLDMYFLVIYDIQDNRIRTHLFNYLKERGLYHLQKSVFLGRNDRAAYKRLYDTIRRIESKLVETDSIVFLPIAENELRKFRIIGRDVEVSAALDEPHTLVI